jgi:diaminopimelate epimerase
MMKAEQFMKFTKMQGIGNDYIYVNCFEESVRNPEETAKKISDRHFGVGSDGLVLICPDPDADFRMRMFNADGSESEMCGNAARCVGKYVYDRGLTKKTEVSLMTGAGIKILQMRIQDGKTSSVKVNMGIPEIQGIGETVEANGRTFSFTRVSMGNPHAVIFLDEVEDFDVAGIGTIIEHDPLFPNRTNTEFAKVLSGNRIRMRVWERGAGETLACGTGACATLVAAAASHLTGRKAVLELNGGNLLIEWDETTNHVFQEGPAAFVFEGVWPDSPR